VHRQSILKKGKGMGLKELESQLESKIKLEDVKALKMVSEPKTSVITLIKITWIKKENKLMKRLDSGNFLI
jgi:hypothetical protein